MSKIKRMPSEASKFEPQKIKRYSLFGRYSVMFTISRGRSSPYSDHYDFEDYSQSSSRLMTRQLFADEYKETSSKFDKLNYSHENLKVNNFYFLIDDKVISYKPNQTTNKFNFIPTKSFTKKAFNQFSFNLQNNPFVIETKIDLELGEFFTVSNQPEQYLGMTLNGFRENLNRR